MPSSITFGGLASGIDTNSIIDKLVAVERQPITTLQNERTAQQTRKALVNDLNTRLSKLADAMRPLELTTGIQGRTVTAPSGAPFSTTTVGTAPIGSYDIGVVQLAQAQRTYSKSFAKADQAGLLGAGTLTLQSGGQTKTVDITAADTLSSVASKISGAGLPLGAAVIYDGSSYRIVVNGQATGDAAAITFSDTGSGLGLDLAANTVVKAQDAKVTVDGFQARSAQNSFSNLIPGLTLNATAVSARDQNGQVVTTALRVQDDPSKLSTALSAIVDQFNSTMAAVKQQVPSGDGKTTLGEDTLAGETIIRDSQVALMRFTTTQAGPAGNAYGTLAEIGLSIDRYGTMSVDQTKLAAAVSKDPTAVTNLLTGSDGIMKKLGAVLKGFTDFTTGSLSTKNQSIDARIKAIDDESARLDQAATAYETNLRQQFSAMEQLISSFNAQASSLSSMLGTASSSNNK